MNNGDPNTRRDGEEPQVPPRLDAALKELPARRVFVPPALDESVLGAARRHLAGPRRSRFVPFRPWFVWPAVAAACFALIGLAWLIAKSNRELAREDLNRDGQVDILDAFQLARGLAAGEKPAAGPDLNGDGVVDRRDAEWIAARAVRLGKGGRS